uniref:Scavenger receptor family member expressed on T cells 1 n=1 Tax=Macaca nemestrina TaxID=9545 RepID=A0A2K6DXE6_MACNE
MLSELLFNLQDCQRTGHRLLGSPSTAPPRSAAQRRARCACAGARTAAPGAWSSGTRAPGAPCVTTAGTWRTRRSCVASWAVVGPSPPWGPPPLALAPDPCGWTRWGAGAARRPCGAALRSGGDAETARTRRTRACAAWVPRRPLCCPCRRWPLPWPLHLPTRPGPCLRSPAWSLAPSWASSPCSWARSGAAAEQPAGRVSMRTSEPSPWRRKTRDLQDPGTWAWRRTMTMWESLRMALGRRRRRPGCC